MDKPASPPVEIQKEFPNGPCIQGKVYVMDTEHQQRIIIMSEESWGDFGTILQSLRQVAKNQNELITKLNVEASVRERMLVDAQTRLDNLRAVRRAEKRAEVEAELNLPNV